MHKIIVCFATLAVAGISAQSFTTCYSSGFGLLPPGLGGLPPSAIQQLLTQLTSSGTAIGAPAPSPPSATVPGLPGPIPFCIPIPPCPAPPPPSPPPPTCPPCACPPPGSGSSPGGASPDLLGLIQTIIKLLETVLAGKAATAPVTGLLGA